MPAYFSKELDSKRLQISGYFHSFIIFTFLKEEKILIHVFYNFIDCVDEEKVILV